MVRMKDSRKELLTAILQTNGSDGVTLCPIVHGPYCNRVPVSAAFGWEAMNLHNSYRAPSCSYLETGAPTPCLPYHTSTDRLIVYTYVCTYMGRHECIYIYIHTYIFVHVYIYIYIYMHIYVYTPELRRVATLPCDGCRGPAVGESSQAWDPAILKGSP